MESVRGSTVCVSVSHDHTLCAQHNLFSDQGKVKSIGVSNYGEHHLQELLANCRYPPAVNQLELHPYLPRTALVEFCKRVRHTLIMSCIYNPSLRCWTEQHRAASVFSDYESPETQRSQACSHRPAIQQVSRTGLRASNTSKQQ